MVAASSIGQTPIPTLIQPTGLSIQEIERLATQMGLTTMEAPKFSLSLPPHMTAPSSPRPPLSLFASPSSGIQPTSSEKGDGHLPQRRTVHFTKRTYSHREVVTILAKQRVKIEISRPNPPLATQAKTLAPPTAKRKPGKGKEKASGESMTEDAASYGGPIQKDYFG